jgi:hypothetical protein
MKSAKSIVDCPHAERFANREALIQFLEYALEEVAWYDEESASYLRMAICQLGDTIPVPTGSEAPKYS